MAAWRPHGRASVNPDNLRGASWATCDRCSMNYNLRDLKWQHQWAGSKLLNLHLLVCQKCLDVPSQFLRTLVLSPDPDPIYNTRPEAYSIDETDYRVIVDGQIRETEDPDDQPRITENDVET